MNRKPLESKSVLHVEIEGVNHDNLRKMADAAGVCVGEMVDVLLTREILRRVAGGATAYRSCIKTPN